MYTVIICAVGEGNIWNHGWAILWGWGCTAWLEVEDKIWVLRALQYLFVAAFFLQSWAALSALWLSGHMAASKRRLGIVDGRSQAAEWLAWLCCKPCKLAQVRIACLM